MKRIGISIICLLFLVGDPVHGDDGPISLGEQVNLAIKAGVDYLKNEQKEDGCFSDPKDQYADGKAALCMLALLKSRVYHKDPAIEKVLHFLQYRPHTKTYSTGVRIMALETLGDKDRIPAILAAADWLAEQFRENEGLWAYPEHASDLSNTQYAVLGLWTAERLGFKTPGRIWPPLTKSVLRHQAESGGFGYHPGSTATGSMTTAGLFVLAVCRDKLKKDPELKSEVDGALKRGWDYMDRRFSAKGNPLGRNLFSRDHFFYYLYGLERSCALDNRKELNGTDWYKEGARELVNCQKDDGSWEGGVAQTSFALLFLRKSTFTSMKKAHQSDLDEKRKSQKNEIARPGGKVPFLRHWLLLGPFENEHEAAFDLDLIKEAEVAPREGKTTNRIKWRPHRSMGRSILLHDVYSKDPGLAYGFTRLRVKEDVDATIWFGSHDGAKIFLDGEEIFNYPFKCADGADRHAIPVTLTRGAHTLLVKAMQLGWSWKFALRVCDRAGKPIPGLIAHLDTAEITPMEIFDGTSTTLSPHDLFGLIPLDRKNRLDFRGKGDLDRLFIEGNDHENPLVHLGAKEKGRKRSKRSPAALTFKVKDTSNPLRFIRRVKVPSKRYGLMARLAILPPDGKASTDFFAQFGVFDPGGGPGGGIRWFEKELIACDTARFPDIWMEIGASLADYANREVLVFLKCSAGGTAVNDWYRENGCLDEFSVVAGH